MQTAVIPPQTHVHQTSTYWLSPLSCISFILAHHWCTDQYPSYRIAPAGAVTREIRRGGHAALVEREMADAITYGDEQVRQIDLAEKHQSRKHSVNSQGSGMLFEK